MRKILLLIVLLSGLAYSQTWEELLDMAEKITSEKLLNEAASEKLLNEAVDKAIKKFAWKTAKWESEWIIDTILFEGREYWEENFYLIKPDLCVHQWVKKDLRIKTICYDLHDSRGCPDTWGLEEWICKNCLRYIRTKENRILVEPPKSEFELLKERVIEAIKKGK